MKDRIPTKILANGALRYGVYDDAGTLLRHEYIKPEDEPTEEGTPLNKATLLDDDTCTLLGLPNTAVPNSALQKMILNGKYAFAVTVKTPLGNPVSGVTVTGLTSMDGESAVTDSDGYILGISSSVSVAISITSPFVDLQNYSNTITSTGPVTPIAVVLSGKATQEIAYTTSASIKFSPDVSNFDACLIGGGGGGCLGSVCGGGGGGGGYIANCLNVVPTPSDVFTIIVGAGGTGGSGYGSSYNGYGSSGGASTLAKNGSSIAVASGGSGGAWCGNPSAQAKNTGGYGNGAGGDGAYGGLAGDYTAARSGLNATGYKFNEPALGVPGGGGGGGGGNDANWQYPEGAAGGAPYGGAGGRGNRDGWSANSTGHTGLGFGGGGGGAGGGTYSGTSVWSQAGNGYQGALFIRWRHKT